MKKNSKRILVALLAAAMALSMTACSEEPAEDASSSEPESSVSEQVSEPEVSDLEVEKDTSGETEAQAQTSEPTVEDTGSSAADTGSSTASQPAADTTTSQPAADQGSSQTDTSSQAQTQAPATTQTNNTSSGKGPMSGYNIEVYDWETPATTCLGESYNGKAGYVLRDTGSNVVGMVPSDVVTQLLRANGLGMAESDVQFSWFVSAFNEYRGVNYDGDSSSSHGSISSDPDDVDIEEFRQEVIRLTNEARVNAGLEEFEVDDTAMEWAQIRAEELASLYSHTRPNGDASGMYGHYTFGENIGMGQDTPQEIVNDWMASSGHRRTMLGDYSAYGNKFGVGCYEANGKLYWTQEFIIWDANA